MREIEPPYDWYCSDNYDSCCLDIACLNNSNYYDIYAIQSVPSSTNSKRLAEQTKLDLAMRQRLAASLDYVHKANLNQASLTVPLHGVNLSKNQFILLYDLTPYATKGVSDWVQYNAV